VNRAAITRYLASGQTFPPAIREDGWINTAEAMAQLRQAGILAEPGRTPHHLTGEVRPSHGARPAKASLSARLRAPAALPRTDIRVSQRSPWCGER
jgi:hypothetical protein